MSTPILAPKDAHVILSKVTANTMLIHDVLPSNKLSFIYTVFKVALNKEIDFEISTSKHISIT